MTSVFIVDDHQMVRTGLAGLLSAHEDLSVAGQASHSVGRVVGGPRAQRVDDPMRRERSWVGPPLLEPVVVGDEAVPHTPLQRPHAGCPRGQDVPPRQGQWS